MAGIEPREIRNRIQDREGSPSRRESFRFRWEEKPLDADRMARLIRLNRLKIIGLGFEIDSLRFLDPLLNRYRTRKPGEAI